jgi:hypothetical protein
MRTSAKKTKFTAMVWWAALGLAAGLIWYLTA